MKTLMLYINNILTARDNVTYSFTKLLGVSGGAAMIYEFISHHSTDYAGFANGIAIVIAAFAAKYYTEKPNDNS